MDWNWTGRRGEGLSSHGHAKQLDLQTALALHVLTHSLLSLPYPHAIYSYHLSSPPTFPVNGPLILESAIPLAGIDCLNIPFSRTQPVLQLAPLTALPETLPPSLLPTTVSCVCWTASYCWLTSSSFLHPFIYSTHPSLRHAHSRFLRNLQADPTAQDRSISQTRSYVSAPLCPTISNSLYVVTIFCRRISNSLTYRSHLPTSSPNCEISRTRAKPRKKEGWLSQQ